MNFLGFGKVPGYRLQKIFERVLGGQVFRLQGVTKNHSWLQGYIAIFEHIVDFLGFGKVQVTGYKNFSNVCLEDTFFGDKGLQKTTAGYRVTSRFSSI